MFSFVHQDAYPREEPYFQTYSYDTNWEGNQNQFYDQPCYQDDHYYEGFKNQSQQEQSQNTSESSRIEAMLAS